MRTQTAKSPERRSDEALALWRRYRATGDCELRNRLISTYTPLVKSIVFRKVCELPAHCEFEDFLSCGLEALMGSIDRYNPDRGATLEQFLWTRVHGAVLDELRGNDWAPRSLRRWERNIARARDEFFASHHRRPSASELSEALGISRDKLARIEAELEASDLASLNGAVTSEEGTTAEHLESVRCTDRYRDPEQAATRAQAHVKLREALERLPQRERTVAVLMYEHELKLREIGEILGVSESRICQMHSSLTRTLREALEPENALFQDV